MENPYLFVGLRGVLAMAPWCRAEWDSGTLRVDAFSLIVTRSAMLGLADFSGDSRVIEHWGHADAGGTWTQDGAEHLLGWLQLDPRVSRHGVDGSSCTESYLIPIHDSVDVVAQALGRVGSVTLTEVNALVPLASMADPVARLAMARDWLALGSCAIPRQSVLIVFDAAASGSSVDEAAILDNVRAMAGGVLAEIELASPEAWRASGLASRQLFNRSFSRQTKTIACTTHRWSADLGAWAIDLVSDSCRRAGVKNDLMIAVRRAHL